MSTAAYTADDAALLPSLAPLLAIDQNHRIAAAPRRLAMPDGRECLVQWQSDADGSNWSLVLHARPQAVRDTETPLARLALHLPEGDQQPSIFWEGPDDAFRAWTAAQLPAIAQDIACHQAADLAQAQARAGVSAGIARKLSGLLPHVVVLGGLAAFAYMFGVVNIH